MDETSRSIIQHLDKDDNKISNEYSLFQSYENEVKMWIDNLDEISMLYGSRKQLSLENMWILDLSISVSFTNRNLVLCVLKGIKGQVPDSWNESIERLRRPKRYVFGTAEFGVNFDNEFIVKAPVKYISNIKAKALIDDANKILEKVSSEDYVYDPGLVGQQTVRFGKRCSYLSGLTKVREAVLMRNFVMMYSTSRRLLNVSRLIQVVIETSWFSESRGFHWYENPILLALRELYKDYTRFPFYESSEGTKYEVECSFALPQLTYALVELWFQYMLNDLTKEELFVLISCYLEKGCVSFDEWILEFKDFRLKCDKYLTCMIKRATGIQYGFQGPVGIVEHVEPEELFKNIDDEYDEFSEEFCRLCPKELLKDLISKKVITVKLKFSKDRVIENVYEAKRLYEYITLAGQHGLFIKNPVCLTIVKSILPRAGMTIGGDVIEKVRFSSEGTDEEPLAFDYQNNKIFSEMLVEGKKINMKYVDKLNRLDLEQEFIRALTNNSGGVSYIPTEAEKQIIPEKILSAFGKKRLMYYILNLSMFDSYEDWRMNVLEQATSGERKQVDRRGRVIQMVSNLAQLGPFLIYLLADLYADEELELGSKKNTGTIRDMFLLLHVTGRGDCVSEGADISGMDATTNDLHTSIVLQVVIDMYQRTGHKRYFWAMQKIVNHLQINSISKNFEETGKILLHPATIMLLLTRRDAETHNFLLNMREQMFKGKRIIVQTSSNVFPSGRYSTNSQHGILNMLLSRVLRKTFLGRVDVSPKVKRLVQKFVVKISGDDIFMTIYVDKLDKGLAVTFSNHLKLLYERVGFKLTSELCRFSGTFLQQKAYFGTVLPKPDRLSIVSSEHGESTKTSIIAGFGEFRDVLDELCGRVSFPQNTKSILYAVANTLRRIRCHTNEWLLPEVQKLYSEDREWQRDYLKRSGREGLSYKLLYNSFYTHLVLPVMYMFSKEGFDLPPMPSKFVQCSPYFGAYTPRGDIHEWFIRLMIGKPENEMKTEEMKLKLKAVIGEYVLNNEGNLKEMLLLNDLSFSVIDKVLDEYLHSCYDHEMASMLGLDWLYLYNEIDTMDMLKRYRINKWPRELRERSATDLGNKPNVSGIAKSRIADEYLYSKGYQPPEELAFHRSPAERVNQAITTGHETESEFAMIRRRVLLYMITKFVRKQWLRSFETEWLYMFRICELKEEMPVHQDAILDVNGGLMMSSGKSVDRDVALARMGSCFYESGMLFTGYYGTKPGPWKEYNHEKLAKFAAKVFMHNERDLKYVWHFANITERYQEDLMRMIRSGSIELDLPWKSVIHVRKCFEIGTRAYKARRMFKNEKVEDTRLDGIIDYIMRDICYGILDNGMLKLELIFDIGFYIRNCTTRYRVKNYTRIFSQVAEDESSRSTTSKNT